MKLARSLVGGTLLACFMAIGPAVLADAESEATEPAAEATGPAAEATEPVAEATEPAAEATEPAAEATEPAAEATEPAAEATEPAAEATEPAAEATEPAAEAAAEAGVDCTPQVDCSEVTDPKMHKRSGRSYWGVGTKKRPPDFDVLTKCEKQLELAYCGMPDDWEVNMFLGMVKSEFEKWECVGLYFQRAIDLAEKDKHRKRAIENRAHYWVELYNEALDFYNDEAFALSAEMAKIATQIDPTDCRGLAILGSAYASDKKYAEAIEVLEVGLDLCPENGTLRDNMYAAYHNRGNEIFNLAQDPEDFRTALDVYVKADDMREDDLANLYYMQVCYMQLASSGDTTAIEPGLEVSKRFLEYAETVGDKKEGLYNWSMLEMEAENWDAAAEAAKSYIKLAPFDPAGYSLYSNVLVRTNQAEEAEAYIIMTNCLRGEALAEPAAWCTSAKTNSGAGSDLAKELASNDCPEKLYVHSDSTGNEMVAAYYPGQKKIFAFYAGVKKGEFDVEVEEP